MVQKYQSPIRVYKYPFELVMAAYERRFPTCEMIPVFVGSDVTKEETSDDGAVTQVERHCKINIEIPYLLKKITGVDFVYFIQKNTLDRRNRILKIEAWNESFANRITIHEFCTYRVYADNPEWTSFEQSASLEVSHFWGFEGVVEKLAVKHYSQNIKKGKEIIEHYINVLKEEGITYIAPFGSKTAKESADELDESIPFIDSTENHKNGVSINSYNYNNQQIISCSNGEADKES